MKYITSFFVTNICIWYERANDADISDGTDWYDYAKTFACEMSAKYNIPVINVAGIIAAYSINATWQNTLQFVPGFLSKRHKGLSSSFKKATAILTADTEEQICDILNGPKITAFFLNIIGDSNVVTIDRHAKNLAGMTDSLTPKRTEMLQHAYRIAADKYNISPASMQAVTWCTYRRITGLIEQYGKNR